MSFFLFFSLFFKQKPSTPPIPFVCSKQCVLLIPLFSLWLQLWQAQLSIKWALLLSLLVILLLLKAHLLLSILYLVWPWLVKGIPTDRSGPRISRREASIIKSIVKLTKSIIKKLQRNQRSHPPIKKRQPKEKHPRRRQRNTRQPRRAALEAKEDNRSLVMVLTTHLR